MPDLLPALRCACLSTALLGGACFSEPGTVDTTNAAGGPDDGGASTSGTGEDSDSITSTTSTTSTTGMVTSPGTSTTQTDGAESETSSGLRCPECATGFCTRDGTCAWAVFVTSELYDGDLGGLSGADAKCNVRAREAGLPGTYMAWLSTHELYAVARIPGHTDPYVLVDGTLVAESFSVFTTHVPDDLDHIYLQHAIDRTEYGDPPTRGTACASLPAGIPVWTSTLTDGTWNTYPTCEAWTSTGLTTDDVLVANAREASSYWTFWCGESDCGTTASLYCFQVSEL